MWLFRDGFGLVCFSRHSYGELFKLSVAMAPMFNGIRPTVKPLFNISNVAVKKVCTCRRECTPFRLLYLGYLDEELIKFISIPGPVFAAARSNKKYFHTKGKCHRLLMFTSNKNTEQPNESTTVSVYMVGVVVYVTSM